MAAATAGELTLTQSLLKQGADKNETTNLGRSAMWYAAANGYLEIVKLFVEQGADKEKASKSGATPLWVARPLK